MALDAKQVRRRELVKLLKSEPEIHCLTEAAYLVMGCVRLQLMLEGFKESELAVLVKCWPETKQGEA